MTIKALIVDDEQLARDEMRFLLKDVAGLEVVGEAGGGEEAVEMVRAKSPDLVFLDIQMPVMDGFQVVRSLAATDDIPLIIFTTAYDQYAIKAFEINAIDYLLKPIEHDRLVESIERAKKQMPKRDEFARRIRELTENIHIGTRFLPRLVMRAGEGIQLIEVEKIAMLNREGKEVKAYTGEGTYISNYGDIDEIEVQVDPRAFIRLGADHLVNVARIRSIIPWSGGNYMMTLEDDKGTEVRLNRSQAQLLKNKVEGVF